jgi:4-amino-4-deoxy-L-arabinose transferase-like glycosyltransferase
MLRGRPEDPRWVRPAAVGLLVGTALLYLSDLASSGWANAYYSAAVQAAVHSWKATLYGSLDPSNFISVDKPPLFLWVMDLSARCFGVNPWAILAPEAVEGVASVGLLYLAMRRAFSPGAALLAGAALATTPVATLMFRFNNPDALLTLLAVAATYAVLRATERGRISWLLLAGALLGLGFLTKYLQVMLLVPPLACTYLVTGPGRAGRRLLHLVAAGLVMAGVGASWVAAVALTPPSERPWIGSTSSNNIVHLIFGYNGFGRLTGTERGSVGFVSPASAGSGGVGLLRVLDYQFRSQIGWLIPAAVLGALAVAWVCRRRGRRERRSAALLAWSGTLVVTAAVFGLGRGIIHPYYSVALAPSVAALAAAGTATLWERRSRRPAAVGLGALVVVTLGWALWIVAGVPPWTRPAETAGVAACGLLGTILARAARRPRAQLAAVVGVGLCLLGPLAVSVETVTTDHATAIPLAGASQSFLPPGSDRPGSLLVAARPTAAVTALLDRDAAQYRWVAAVVGAERAAGYELAAGAPVMAVGGFNGTDPVPTPTAFRADVAAGRIHWFISAGPPLWAGSPPGFMRGAQAITAWVEHRFPAHQVGAFTLYDLAEPK